MAFDVTVEGGDAMAMLQAIGTSSHIRHILECCGQSVENAAVIGARSHGGRRFWAEVANSVSHQFDGDSMVVGASHYAAAFKQTGGVIRAPGHGAGSLNRRALTIPMGIARQNRWDTDEAESHGYQLFRAKDIIFGRIPQRKPKRRNGHGNGEGAADEPQAIPLFVLRKQVMQNPDPWFPEGAALEAAVSEGIDFFTSRNGGNIV